MIEVQRKDDSWQKPAGPEPARAQQKAVTVQAATAFDFAHAVTTRRSGLTLASS
jgi:hypothetical protein